MTDRAVQDLVDHICSTADGFVSFETLLPPHFFWLNRYVFGPWFLGRAVGALLGGKRLLVGAFANSSLPFLLVGSLLLRRSLILFNNHNLATAGPVALAFLRMCLRFGARLVIIECVERAPQWLLNAKTRGQVITIPASVPNEGSGRISARAENAVVIGTLGRIRAEKRFDRTLGLLSDVRDRLAGVGVESRILVGCPASDWQMLKATTSLPLDVHWCNTSAYEDYLGCAETLDVCIIDYDRERYAGRPSGVVCELAQSRVICVAGGGLAIERQLRWPVDIGVYLEREGLTDNDFERLLAMLQRAPDFDQYCSARSVPRVCNHLLKALDD